MTAGDEGDGSAWRLRAGVWAPAVVIGMIGMPWEQR